MNTLSEWGVAAPTTSNTPPSAGLYVIGGAVLGAAAGAVGDMVVRRRRLGQALMGWPAGWASFAGAAGGYFVGMNALEAWQQSGSAAPTNNAVAPVVAGGSYTTTISANGGTLIVVPPSGATNITGGQTSGGGNYATSSSATWSIQGVSGQGTLTAGTTTLTISWTDASGNQSATVTVTVQ
jgi:hypothetical protein